jgi:PAS domain S-box-containing protein
MNEPLLQGALAERVLAFTTTSFAIKSVTGILLDVNPAFCKLTGYTREQLVGQHHSLLTFPGDLDATEAVLEAFRVGRYTEHSWKKRYVRQDGGLVHCRKKLSVLDGTGDSMRLILQIEDLAVEDRLEQERAFAFETMRTEHERVVTTLRSIGDGVISTDAQGRVEYLNPMAETLTGWSLPLARGRPVAEVFHIVHETTGERVANPIVAALMTGNVVELANHTELLPRSGEKRSVADCASPIRDSQDRIVGAVLVFRDVTDSRALMRHLQDSERLESLGVLAGGIAHDFNNLLGGIFANIELARGLVDETSPLAARLDKALKAFHRATDLTRQLLTFAKGGAPQLVPTSIARLVEESADLVLSGAAVEVSVHAEPSLPDCWVDPNMISQVINNLLINAVQAMPNGGALALSIEAVEVDPAHSPLAPGPYVRVLVTDQGSGIAPELLPKIFDPFFTTKPQGHGLGLSICRSIVNRHDGELVVTSQVGRGTCVTILLPAGATGPATAPVETNSSFQGTGALLVMDDNEDLRTSLGTILQNFGFEVVMVEDGVSAVAAVAQRTEQPFLAAFLDLTIRGGMGGKEAARQIGELAAQPLLVVVSGYSDDPVVADPHAYGFSEVLRKPFLIADVAAVLRRLPLGR